MYKMKHAIVGATLAVARKEQGWRQAPPLHLKAHPVPLFGLLLALIFLTTTSAFCMGYHFLSKAEDNKIQVVDADTGKPIEGANVAIEWIKKRATFGSLSSKTIAVKERRTDKDGFFKPYDRIEKGQEFTLVVYKFSYKVYIQRGKPKKDKVTGIIRLKLLKGIKEREENILATCTALPSTNEALVIEKALYAEEDLLNKLRDEKRSKK